MSDVLLAFPLSIAAAFIIGFAGYLSASYLRKFSKADVFVALTDFVEYFTETGGEYKNERRRRQLDAILSAATVVSAINVLNVVMVAWILISQTGNMNAILWAVTIGMMAIFHSLEVNALTRKQTKVSRANKKIRRIIRNVTMFGAVWGLAGFFFIDDITSQTTLIVLVALIGTAAGGVAAMSVLPPAALMFLAAIAGPTFYKLLVVPGGEYVLLTLYGCAYVFVLGAVTAGVYDTLINGPSQKYVTNSKSNTGGTEEPVATKKEKEAA